MEKICKGCGELKDFDDFWNHPCTIDKKRAKCKKCISKQSNEFQKKKRKEFPETYRNTRLKQDFGITLEDFNSLLVEQGLVCAICGSPPDENKVMSVDHNHETGKVRGIVHQRCNAAIGLLQDSADICIRAAEYIKNDGFRKDWLTA